MAVVCAAVAAVDVPGSGAGGSVSTGAAIGSTCGGAVAADVVAAVVAADVVGTVEAGAATAGGIAAIVGELTATVEVTLAASTWVAMVVAGDVATRLDLGVFAALITTMPNTAAGINMRFRFHQVRSGRLIGAMAV
jgi:hypothetical protein